MMLIRKHIVEAKPRVLFHYFEVAVDFMEKVRKLAATCSNHRISDDDMPRCFFSRNFYQMFYNTFLHRKFPTFRIFFFKP